MRVLLESRRKNKDVVEEHEDKPAYHVHEATNHESIKGAYGTCEAKWHHYELVLTSLCAKASLTYIFIDDTYLVIPTFEINL